MNTKLFAYMVNESHESENESHESQNETHESHDEIWKIVMNMMKIPRMSKNRDESDETQSEYYDHEAIRLRGQKF